ncbi:tRNA-dihydrouridine(20a/20b) synthase [NAD(P)+]-like isoform X2 [Eurytemora carolleeae]|uniref:tRNA-dihydrouridine(20a/20b) synthase [NAD(P)+]-like isoform X2 n=1 Tax=Eurytemora carolleeae TaxID=1294199 RepID=UPI000C75C48F|nr:tRNA-dihydrouridine(20a/20b) synthase [NAD(P)+]-like isoform X2 [Eurytemora carolleeae]|eukprot:XP_023347012.1 tRNA-dihydrouridine(20a/20b) synthase [NAD(P)+]-like isoform X2 [Eurytemora affinis]
MDLFENVNCVKICAPMVRYSKLPFRLLVKDYGCDLMYSPMIMADSFYNSQKARDNEFITSEDDRPLIVQFAANQSIHFSESARMVEKYCNGVDLNCGCPQKWAIKEGIGACLINNPEFVADVVKQTRMKVSNPNFSVSVKIRIHEDISQTVDLCRQIQAAGASYITVHGRTRTQKGEPVNLEAISTISKSLSIPVVANGDIKTLDDVNRVHEITGCKGVMSARGMLENPAMYAGYTSTPLQCVSDWVRISLERGTPFTTFHHHLIYMLDKLLPRGDRRLFNSLASTSAVIDFLRLDLVCTLEHRLQSVWYSSLNTHKYLPLRMMMMIKQYENEK